MSNAKIFFAPQLFIKNGVRDVDFYSRAFGAMVIRKWMNDDGSVHVAELSIQGALFHIHEERLASGTFSPDQHGGVTATIGLFVERVDEFMKRAIREGATEISPAQDYDYGYRQGEIKDIFGHHWLIESKTQTQE